MTANAIVDAVACIFCTVALGWYGASFGRKILGQWSAWTRLEPVEIGALALCALFVQASLSCFLGATNVLRLHHWALGNGALANAGFFLVYASFVACRRTFQVKNRANYLCFRHGVLVDFSDSCPLPTKYVLRARFIASSVVMAFGGSVLTASLLVR